MGLTKLIALSAGLAAGDYQCLAAQKTESQKAGREAENLPGMGVIGRASPGTVPGKMIGRSL